MFYIVITDGITKAQQPQKEESYAKKKKNSMVLSLKFTNGKVKTRSEEETLQEAMNDTIIHSHHSIHWAPAVYQALCQAREMKICMSHGPLSRTFWSRGVHGHWKINDNSLAECCDRIIHKMLQEHN